MIAVVQLAHCGCVHVGVEADRHIGKCATHSAKLRLLCGFLAHSALQKKNTHTLARTTHNVGVCPARFRRSCDKAVVGRAFVQLDRAKRRNSNARNVVKLLDPELHSAAAPLQRTQQHK